MTHDVNNLIIQDLYIQFVFPLSAMKDFDKWGLDGGECYLGYVMRGEYEANIGIKEHFEPHWLREGKKVVTGYTFEVSYLTPINGMTSGSYHSLEQAIGAACGAFATIQGE